LTFERKASAFIDWSVEHNVNLHA